MPGEWHTQTVELDGQRLRVSVNNVRVLQHVFDKRVISGQVGLFAVGPNRIEFENVTVERQPSGGHRTRNCRGASGDR
jgi:hypothetical protein